MDFEFDPKNFRECLRSLYSEASPELLCRELDRLDHVKNLLEINVLVRIGSDAIELYFQNKLQLSEFQKIAFPQSLDINPCPADPCVN
ncbi:MAG TPA: hypothetical protein PKX38_09200 [Alphaproteobacteria bacterium]|jgi:hypothetical protein|nr:hypothetical protein [Micavibrio sp.]MBK9563562.1 hypothetical protein [Micavibrio sp.]HQX28095.1 hypothetical protein [Alphaproteobacteria bacterium]